MTRIDADIRILQEDLKGFDPDFRRAPEPILNRVEDIVKSARRKFDALAKARIRVSRAKSSRPAKAGMTIMPCVSNQMAGALHSASSINTSAGRATVPVPPGGSRIGCAIAGIRLALHQLEKEAPVQRHGVSLPELALGIAIIQDVERLQLVDIASSGRSGGQILVVILGGSAASRSPRPRQPARCANIRRCHGDMLDTRPKEIGHEARRKGAVALGAIQHQPQGTAFDHLALDHATGNQSPLVTCLPRLEQRRIEQEPVSIISSYCIDCET